MAPIWLAQSRNLIRSLTVAHISIIVNRNFGSRLFQLADYSHVWVCSSPANRVTPDQLAKCNANASDERSLNVFQAGKKESPEAMLGRILNQAVAAHANWRDILVHGVTRTKEVEATLRAAGAGNVYMSQKGVYATRSP